MPFPERLSSSVTSLEFLTLVGKYEGSQHVGGTRLVVFPRFLAPYRPKNTTSRDPYPPSSPDPPFRPGPPPPPAPLWEGARGKGSRLERGSRLVAFSNCERLGVGIPRAGSPLTSRDPLSLLTWISAQRPPNVRATSLPETFGCGFFAHSWKLPAYS